MQILNGEKMDGRRLSIGLREIGLGIILFIATLEVSNILLDTDIVVLSIFIVKIVSWILIVFGCITAIMAFAPENKKAESKIVWEQKKEEKEKKKDEKKDVK